MKKEMTLGESVIAGVPLAQFAAVTAALAEGFPLRAVLSVEGLDPGRWAEADRHWTERLDQDPALLSQYQTDLAAAQDRLTSREEPAPEEGASVKPPSLRAGKARLVRSGTGLIASAGSLGTPETPPAVALSAPEPVVTRTPSSAPSPEPAEPGLVTMEAQAAPSQPAPAPAPPVYDPEEPRPPLYGAGKVKTQVGLVTAAEVFPFRAPPVAAGEPPDPRAQGSAMAATNMRGYGLPFRPAPSSEEPPPETQAASVSVEERPKPELNHGLPFRPAPFSEEPPTEKLAAISTRLHGLPFTEPPMSLERHASLCLEIALDPARAGEALARYHVTAADKVRADEHYRARIAADPELRAQWNHFYTVYHAWFVSRPRP